MTYLDNIIRGLCICTAPLNNNLPEVESSAIVNDATVQLHQVSIIDGCRQRTCSLFLQTAGTLQAVLRVDV
jgi:hypothetical protein